MTEQVIPATDDEVARVEIMIHGTFPILFVKAETVDGLLARINADRAKIAALEAETERRLDLIRQYGVQMAKATAENASLRERLQVAESTVARYEGLIVAQDPTTWRNHPGACCCVFCEWRGSILARLASGVVEPVEGSR